MTVKANLDLAFSLVRQAAADENFGAELTEASANGPMILIVRSVARTLVPRDPVG